MSGGRREGLAASWRRAGGVVALSGAMAREQIRYLAATVVPIHLAVLAVAARLPAVSEGESGRLIRAVAVGSCAFLVILSTGLAAAGTLPGDRRSGRLAVLLATPLSRGAYILAASLGAVRTGAILVLLLFGVTAPFLRLVAAPVEPRTVLGAALVGSGRIPAGFPSEGVEARLADRHEWGRLLGALPPDAIGAIRARGRAEIVWTFSSVAAADIERPVEGVLRPQIVTVDSFPSATAVTLSLLPPGGGPPIEQIELFVRGKLDQPFRFSRPPPGPHFAIGAAVTYEGAVLQVQPAEDAFGRETSGLTLLGRPTLPERELFLAFAAVLFPAALAAGVAVAIATFVSAWVAAFAALSAYATGRLVPTVEEYVQFLRREPAPPPGVEHAGHAHAAAEEASAIERIVEQVALRIAEGVTRVVPDLSVFDASSAFAAGQAIPWGYFVRTAPPVVIFVGCSLAFGALVQHRAEVKGS